MQEALFYENFDDALRAVVQAAGGAKVMGAKLRPNKSPDEAARWLLNCLNTARPEHLEPDDVLTILRVGRAIGCHAGMAYIGTDAGYRCEAIDPEDERAALMREFGENVKKQAAIAAKLERLSTPPTLRSVA